MKALSATDEIFCLQFENNALRSLLFENEAERWVHGFITKQVEDEHLFRYKLACQYSKGKNVIEVACGCGYGSWMLATEGQAATVWAADIHEDSIRYGSLRYPHESITRDTKDVMTLGFEKTFDLAVSFETIEHLDDADGFLKKMHDALRDNGLLLISTPIASKTTTAPHNRFHTIEWTFEDFHRVLTPYFIIEKVYLQSIEHMRSRISHIINRVAGKPDVYPDPKLVEWRGGWPSNVWRGYQVVVCSKI
jgi:2-polyprenyl-3-methyl-5-hydroxy-6-metoxy-1,4-benzoquinol methylase